MGGKNLGTDSDVEKLVRQARKAGFDVYILRNNHIRWIAPLLPGQKVPDRYDSPLTFGDKRRISAIKKFLREHSEELTKKLPR